MAAQAFTGEFEVKVRHLWGQPLGVKARLEIVQHQGTPKETRRIEGSAASVEIHGGERSQWGPLLLGVVGAGAILGGIALITRRGTPRGRYRLR